MNFYDRYLNENEKPLANLVDGYSHTSIFRTMAFVGDSLSSGEFQVRDKGGRHRYFDMYEYSWGQYIARKNGIKAYNFSRGGMSTKEYMESFAENNGFWDKDKACQAYVIALGVNDIYNMDMEIGSITDVDRDDYRNNKPTFVGCYAAIISRYKEISPRAKFFLVTFPNTNTPERDHKTLAMIKALYEFADYFKDTYVIDLYKYGPVYDEEFYKRFFLSGHMNPSGYILTAQLVDSYIDYIVRHRYEDFKTVAFIGKDEEIEQKGVCLE